MALKISFGRPSQNTTVFIFDAAVHWKLLVPLRYTLRL